MAEFVRILRGEVRAERVPLVEYLVDDALMRPLVESLGRTWGDGEAYWDNFIAMWYHLGYDYVRLELALPFPAQYQYAHDTAAGAQRDRQWADQKHGMIASWEDLERYPWPRVEDFDFGPYEYVATHLPEGLGLIANHAGGPFEWVKSLLSYEGLAYLLHDDPDLVQAVAERVGALLEQFYQHLVELPGLIALFPGDDMGFRTATLIAPDYLRRLTLPWHQCFADLAHSRGLLYLLHCCGNVQAILPYMLDTVKIDGKHSFEEAIMPVTEAYRRYGDRIALLGGVDVDVLCRRPEAELRAYVRQILDVCAGGRYALGSGNSVPSYTPLQSYLAMLDEGLRYAL